MKLTCAELLTLDCVEQLVFISKQMRAECEPDVAYDEQLVRARALHLLSDMHRTEMNVWLVRDGDFAVGFAVGIMGDYLMFSKAQIANMTLWYVIPAYRNRSRAAFELLHNYENWATINGAFRIEVGAARKGVEDARKINAMFSRRGFTSYGEIFYRDTR